MKAFWNNQLIAESNETILIEGNHYFPVESINRKYFQESDTNTICPWKGIAHYLDIHVSGEVNTDAACYYPEASKITSELEGRITFWKDVEIIK